MAGDQDRAEAQRRAQIANAEQRLAAVRSRMDQAYEDKLDGRLDEQMWARKMHDWRDQEIELEAALSRLETPPTVGSALYGAADFRTRASCSFFVPYAQSQGTRPIAQIRAFELRHGWRKPHAYIWEAPVR